jgi:hypothetical protein
MPSIKNLEDVKSGELNIRLPDLFNPDEKEITLKLVRNGNKVFTTNINQ